MNNNNIDTTKPVYYAYYWHYGLRCVNEKGREMGSLMAFPTKKSRDEWVSDERYENGNLHREDIDSRVARRYMIHELENTSDWSRLLDIYDSPSGIEKYATTNQLKKAWIRMRDRMEV